MEIGFLSEHNLDLCGKQGPERFWICVHIGGLRCRFFSKFSLNGDVCHNNK